MIAANHYFTTYEPLSSNHIPHGSSNPGQETQLSLLVLDLLHLYPFSWHSSCQFLLRRPWWAFYQGIPVACPGQVIWQVAAACRFWESYYCEYLCNLLGHRSAYYRFGACSSWRRRHHPVVSVGDSQVASWELHTCFLCRSWSCLWVGLLRWSCRESPWSLWKLCCHPCEGSPFCFYWPFYRPSQLMGRYCGSCTLVIPQVHDAPGHEEGGELQTQLSLSCPLWLGSYRDLDPAADEEKDSASRRAYWGTFCGFCWSRIRK